MESKSPHLLDWNIFHCDVWCLVRIHSDPFEAAEDSSSSGEIPLSKLRRFIAFARERCGPRLSPAAAEKLSNQYVLMRSGASRHEQQTGKRGNIPIAIR